MKFWFIAFIAFSTLMSLTVIGYASEGDKQTFISIGDMAVGMSEYMAPQNTDLVGKEFKVYLEDGRIVNINVLDRDTLKWENIEKNGEREKGVSSYYCVSPRNSIYLIDFVCSYGDTRKVSLVMNTNTGSVLAMTGFLPSEAEASVPLWKRVKDKIPMTSVKVEYVNGSYNKPFTKSTQKIERTTDTVGRRVQYKYSSRDVYEHTFINDHSYVWNCISGNEKGNADVDAAQYFKIDNNLYLHVWQEKAVPTIGLVIEDYSAKRTYGTIYGYKEFDFKRVMNIPIGSYITDISTMP